MVGDSRPYRPVAAHIPGNSNIDGSKRSPGFAGTPFFVRVLFWFATRFDFYFLQPVLLAAIVLIAGLSPVSPSFLPSFLPSPVRPFPPFPPFPCPRSSFPFTFSCVQFFFSLFMPPTALPSSQYLFFPPFPFFSLFPVMNPSFLVLFTLLVLITPCFLPHAFPCPYIAYACARTPILFRSCSGLLSPVRPLRCSCRGPFLRRCGRN